MVLELIILATIVVSLISLIGIIFIGVSENLTRKLMFLMVSFATGALLGTAFLDLMPEAIAGANPETVFSIVLLGILVFFFLEKAISWHHHHDTHDKTKEKPVGYLTLIGDGFHNFFDGVAIAAGFLVSVPVGVTTTFAITLHEIPQEIGDYGLLVHSGFTRAKALFFNLISALTAVLGALAFIYFSTVIKNLEVYGLAFSAGGLIYIANSDLIPELHKENSIKKSILQLILVTFGIAAIWVATKLVR